jgi:hypothetical protein
MSLVKRNPLRRGLVAVALAGAAAGTVVVVGGEAAHAGNPTPGGSSHSQGDRSRPGSPRPGSPSREAAGARTGRRGAVDLTNAPDAAADRGGDPAVSAHAQAQRQTILSALRDLNLGSSVVLTIASQRYPQGSSGP